METSFRARSMLIRPRATARRSVVAVLALMALVLAESPADGSGRPLRDRSLAVAREVLSSIGHRIMPPVRLDVVSDSADAILGGFSEALTEAGFSVRLTELSSNTGTVWTVRRIVETEGAGEGLDVRVEQWPERSVVYSRLWWSGSETLKDDGDGVFERVIVPMTVGVGAALIVYLFFTVRS